MHVPYGAVSDWQNKSPEKVRLGVDTQAFLWVTDGAAGEAETFWGCVVEKVEGGLGGVSGMSV